MKPGDLVQENIRTPNAMVKDFYGLQGFTKVSDDEEGNTVWEYVIPAEYEKKQHVISVNESEKQG